jgi:hypothetical protein
MKLMATASAFLIAFFAPVAPVLLAVGGFIALDTLTGILKSIKLHGWPSIRSAKLARVATKNLVYCGSVLVFFLLDKAMFNEVLIGFIPTPYVLTKAMGLILCSIEAKSIDENFEAVYGVSLWERFKLIIKRTKSVVGQIQEIKKA